MDPDEWFLGARRAERSGGVLRRAKKFLEVMNVFIISVVVIVSWIYSYSNLPTVHFKYVPFIVYQMYLNKAFN